MLTGEWGESVSVYTCEIKNPNHESSDFSCVVDDIRLDFHFLSLKRKKIKVRLHQAVAGGAHPRRIEMGSSPVLQK